MPIEESTCWTVIRDAARGELVARQSFSRRYFKVVRNYLEVRWPRSPRREFVEDAVQDVFLECFRPESPLGRARPREDRRFRAFLHAIVRNVARRYEERSQAEARVQGEPPTHELPAESEDLATAFDRAWARGILEQASRRQGERARLLGEEALRRIQILELRFAEGLPVREIADRLDLDREFVHEEYRKGREEFKRALREEILFHAEGPLDDLEAECRRIQSYFR